MVSGYISVACELNFYKVIRDRAYYQKMIDDLMNAFTYYFT